jgi:hypothetical protein
MHTDFCFDAATEGATGGLLILPTRRCCSKAKAAPQEGYPVSAAKDSIKAGFLHLASLQRGNLILGRIAITLLHERLPWVTIQ